MDFQLTPAEDLSLQHLLENGLIVLSSSTLESGRRNRTLEGLSRIFSEADSASQALHAENVLFGVEQRPALESFSLVFHHLDPYFGESLPGRLQETSNVFDKLKRRKPVGKASRDRARELIEKLLLAFDEERSRLPLDAPLFITSLG